MSRESGLLYEQFVIHKNAVIEKPITAGTVKMLKSFRPPFKKGGAVESKVDLFSKGFNHKPEIIGGYMQEECRKIISDFFEKI